jgi:hypothetical protein
MPAPAGAAIRSGDAALGVPVPATRWYFAEGYTGTGFAEYLTIANFGSAPA